MKQNIYHAIILVIGTWALQGCKKDADQWVGIYNGKAGQSIQRVLVNKVDGKTLKVELQSVAGSLYFTYATIQSAKLNSATEATIDEDGQIAGFSGTYRFSGSMTRNGNSLTISGKATNKANPADISPYYFTGSK
jgi:heat shock protein HslJ